MPNNKVKVSIEVADHKKSNLLDVIGFVIKRKNAITRLVHEKKTPFYVLDKKALDDSVDGFLSAFKKEIPSFKAYYAVKINHHPMIVKRVVEKGMGLDVGSRREIDIAIDAGCKDIVYFSPGKSDDDLSYAIKYADIITIHMDSFNELKRLVFLTDKSKRKIRAGVRIHTDESGGWKKYGIHINELKKFFEEAAKCQFLDLQGIHFHMSRNKDATFYEDTIRDLSLYLKRNFVAKELDKIKYIDFGGGFEVYGSEGYYLNQSSQGRETMSDVAYNIREAMSVNEYARKIGQAIRTHLDPVLKAFYYSEPGRVICNGAMHIVLSVADAKDERNVILDGGVNMVGWQRFEYEYFPLVDISSPSKKEIRCNMWGNLCTTWDIWGYYCYAKKMKEGDIIVVPNQGALTYSLAQNFIQPIPPVYLL